MKLIFDKSVVMITLDFVSMEYSNFYTLEDAKNKLKNK